MSVLDRNNVTIAGRGTRPMVFAHGYGCDQAMWRCVAPAFADDYRLVLFDHVGAGRSDLAAYSYEKYASLRGYADDLLELCAALDIRHGIFVGHSVSAMIGVLAAIKEPERFDRLILIGPSPCYIDDDGYVGGFTREDIAALLDFQDSNYLGWSSELAPAIMGNPDRPELATELTESFCRADLALVRARALILQCREDAIAPPAVGEYVHRQLAGSELVILDATGHCPHLSAPAATIAAMRRFLEG